MNRIDEYRKKRRKAIRNRIILFTILFCVVVTGLAVASSRAELKIDKIIVSGNRIVETKDIEDTVRQDIVGKYFRLFSRANSFIFPEKKIQLDLLQKYKRLLDLTLKVTDIKTLEITVSERQAKYIWCGDIFPTIDDLGAQCYFLDDDGYVFDTSPYFSGGVYFKFYGQIHSASADKLGAHFLSNDFQRVVNFKETMENMDLKVISLEVKDDNDVYAYLSSGASIIFKLSDDFEKLAENLQSALATEPLHTNFNKKYNSLLYIDLRFGNKVYYKFRSEIQ